MNTAVLGLLAALIVTSSGAWRAQQKEGLLLADPDLDQVRPVRALWPGAGNYLDEDLSAPFAIQTASYFT